MSNIVNPHRFAAATSLLLDDYGSANAAYSLRLLRTDYSGNCVKVRRASDDTELDIGFASGVLDTSALESHCSGTDGFVTTWYDQSGEGYNGTQTTAAYQPQIVSSGSTITDNSKPAIEFDGSDDHLDVGNELFGNNTPGEGLGTNDMSIWAVASVTHTGAHHGDTHASTERFTLIGEGTASTGNYFKTFGDKIGVYLTSTDNAHFYRVSGGNRQHGTSDTVTSNQQFIGGYTWGGTTHTLSLDDGTAVTDTFTPAPWGAYHSASIGSPSSSIGSEEWDGKISEIVQWHSDQESNRAAILSEINTFYGTF